jgi:hypothetical protein
MRVRDLEGKESVWSLTGRTVTTANDRSIRSDLHINARTLLKETFPTLTILEEVPIYLHGRRSIAYLDFYLPLRKIAIEVQGEQHFKYVPFFHGNMNGFIESRRRDTEKYYWCEINGITLIPFIYSESLDEWKAKFI